MVLPVAAARRLLADLKQLRREQLSTCNAEPAGDDLRHWRLSLTCSEGPHAGTIFHGKIAFPDDYPSNPPTVQLCTQLAHPNVFKGHDFNQHKYRQEGYYICLNMLRPPGDRDAEAYSGWSSAYTVHAILMQLSSFLFAENIPQDYGGSARCKRNVHDTKRDADAFHDEHGHKYPPLTPLTQLEPTFTPLRVDRKMQLKRPFGSGLLSVVGDDGGPLLRVRANPEPMDKGPNSFGLRNARRYATVVGNSALCSGSVYFEVVLERLPSAEERTVIEQDLQHQLDENQRQKAILGCSSLPQSTEENSRSEMPELEILEKQEAQIRKQINDARSSPIIKIGIAEHYDAKLGLPDSDSDDYMYEDVCSTLLGGRGSNSWAYDLSAGCCFHDGQRIDLNAATDTDTQIEAKKPADCSVAATAGDTLGVTLRRCNETGTVSLSFARNGQGLGEVCFYTRQALTPAVTLKCPFGQQQAVEVCFNFGQHPFNFPPRMIQAEKQELSLPRVASADERCRRSLLLRLGTDGEHQHEARLYPTHQTDAIDDNGGSQEQMQQYSDPFDLLHDEIVLTILKYLEPRDLAAAARTNRILCAAMCRYNVWERREALCFHSKVTMDEDVLGLGFTIEHHGRSADIKGIHAELDLLSQSAYDSGVCHGVWQEQFDRWIPLWLCDEHGERAWPRLFACVHDCATAGRTGAVLTPTAKSNEARRRARQYLEFFGKAMNAFVVSMMDNNDGSVNDNRGRHSRQERPQQSDKQNTALHASERALLGYCSFHHLLLAFCARFPLMREEANSMVARAIDGRTSKDDLPDLGVFLALLTITDQSWSNPQLAWAVLGETLDRNVRWALPNMPYLRSFERTMTHEQAEHVRNAEMFLADWAVHTTTSRRVLMFQAYFLRVVGRPKGVRPSVVLNHYNCSLGRPTARMVQNLRVACEEILATSDWPGFFNRLGLPLPAKAQVAKRLRVAVVNSRQKNYHGTGPRSGSSGSSGSRRERRHMRR